MRFPYALLTLILLFSCTKERPINQYPVTGIYQVFFDTIGTYQSGNATHIWTSRKSASQGEDMYFYLYPKDGKLTAKSCC